MLDSGISTHIKGDVNLMKKVEKISLSAIGLPNKACTMTNEQSSVALEQGLELKKVLYVPKLNCSLVSLSTGEMLNGIF